MTRIKICGIKEEAHALAVAEAGADFIGLVFAPSPRQVTPALAEKLAAAVKQSGAAIEIVGVFVNMPAEKVNEIADSCFLDRVQLSGDESPEYCNEITKPVIKAIRVNTKNAREFISTLSTEAGSLPQKHIYLLDSHVPDKYGGTGMTFDWNLARQVAQHYPIVMAGGLTPENVTHAIKTAAPWGVDTSSGVETSGIKDISKIKAFINAVRRADDK